MARSAPAPIEDDELETDANNDENGAVYVDDELAKVLRALEESGGSQVLVRVWRTQAGRPDSLLPPLSVTSEALGDGVEDLVANAYGGGGYRLEFRVRGRVVGNRRFDAAGDPFPVRRESTPGAASSHAPPAAPVLDAEAIRREERERIRQEEEARTREEERETRRMAPIAAALENQGKILAALAERIAAPAPAQVTEPREDEIAKFARLKKLFGSEGGADPAVTALTTQVAALQAQLNNKAQEAERLEHRREQRRLRLTLKKIARSKKTKEQTPLEKMLETVTGTFALTKALDKIGEDADGDGDDDFGDAIRSLKKPAVEFVKDVAKGFAKDMKKTMRTVAAGAASGVAPTWNEWVGGVLQNTARAADVEFVRASLERYGPQIDRACAIKTKPELLALVRESHGDAIASQVEALPDAELQKFFQVLETLKRSVATARSTPAPTPPVAEAVGPEDESDEDDQGEDEEEGEDDGEDEDE